MGAYIPPQNRPKRQRPACTVRMDRGERIADLLKRNAAAYEAARREAGYVGMPQPDAVIVATRG